jgi:alanine dehydrogenase
MRIGVPKETKNHEYRIGLTPSSVRQLVDLGHEIWVEADAGFAIGYNNDDFIEAGARS